MQETVRSDRDGNSLTANTVLPSNDDEPLRRSLERQRRYDLSLLRAFANHDV